MPKPVNLVLSGGGVNGIGHVGAVIELMEHGYLDHVEKILGASAGAFIGAGLAINLSKQEMMGFLKELNFPAFLHSPSVSRFFKRYGACSGQVIRGIINKYIKNKTGLENATYADMQALKGKYQFKDLYVTVVNLSKSKVETFSHETTPHANIADTMYASMAVPLLFEAMLLKKEADGRFVRDKKGDVYLDGATIDTLPLHYFDNTNPNTLGLYLVTPQIYYRLTQQKELNSTQFTSFFAYAIHLIETIVFGQKHHAIAREGLDRIVLINDGGNKQYNFYLDEKTKIALFESGRQAALEYIAKDKSPALKPPGLEKTLLRAKL